MSAKLTQEGQPSTFPARILTVLHELADRKGTPTHGPAEDANGEPLQDDADAALAWITARQEGRPALSALLERAAWICECYSEFIRSDVMSADIERHPYLPEIDGTAEDLRATLAAGSQAVQVPGWKMVPVEPTPEMIAAAAATPGIRAIDAASSSHQLRGNPLPAEAFETGSPIQQAYRAMLNAAPQQPLAGGEVG